MIRGKDSRGRFAKGNVPWNKKGQCVHHWIIDNNNVGTCKKCGEVRDFGVLLTEKSKRLSERQAEIAWDITHGKRRGRPPKAKISASLRRWHNKRGLHA